MGQKLNKSSEKMQYNGKNEILIWAVLSEAIVKFHNFASLGGYFLLLEP